MFNNIVLDVAIGLVFIYLLYSLLATVIQELIASKLAFRSKVLEKSIIRMLEDGKATSNKMPFIDRLMAFRHLFGKFNHLTDKPIATWFYAHPLIKYLGEDNFYSKPAYLSAQNFSKVITDLLKGASDTANNEIQQINDSIMQGKIFHLPIDVNNDKLSPAIAAIRSQLSLNATETYVINPEDTVQLNADTTLFLQSLWKESGADIEKFKKKLEGWFDDTMERTSGWYKRYVKYILFVVGLGLAIGFNVDSVKITKKLMHDPKLREQMVQNANTFLEKNKQLSTQLQNVKSDNEEEATLVTSIKNKLAKPGIDPMTKEDLEKQLAIAEQSLHAGNENYSQLKTNYDSSTAISNKLMDSAKAMINGEIKNVNDLMGLGWHERVKDQHSTLHGFMCFRCNDMDSSAIVGWLITALAISLGAPFWFDLLNKLTKLRATGGKVDSSGGQATSGGQTASQAQTPVSVNVNTQSGEEAVG